MFFWRVLGDGTAARSPIAAKTDIEFPPTATSHDTEHDVLVVDLDLEKVHLLKATVTNDERREEADG